MAQFTDQEIERLARRRAGAKLGWYVHAAVYVIVNIAWFGLATSFGRRPWSIFPAIGWGVGLALHGISVFLLGAGSSFRENLVQRERERLQRQRDRAAGR
jgi:hypothetical protein